MKKIYFIFTIIISAHTHAMELEVKKENYIPWYTLHKVSHFKTLPADVLDLIASLLTFDNFEDEQEFIERTKILTQEETPEIYKKHMPSYELENIIPNHGYYFLSAHSSDNKAIGVIKMNEWGNSICPFTIINVANNQKIYAENIDTTFCSALAVSRDQHMFAYIHKHQEDTTNHTGNHDLMVYNIQTLLTIKNIISQKAKEHIISYPFNMSDDRIIAFNKQGTHIILHGTIRKIIDDSYHKDKRDTPCSLKPIHKIIPLTINTPTPQADYKKTLLKYFKQRNVFEDNTKQIKLTQ